MVHFIASQAPIQQAAGVIRIVAVVGLAGGAAGIFSYFTIRLADHLAGHRLAEILRGDQPISWRWIYLAGLGIILGGAVAFFARLGTALL